MQNRNYAKLCNGPRLVAELVEAGLEHQSRFFGICMEPTTPLTSIQVADDFTPQEGTTCDAVVAAHVAQTLDEAKHDKNTQIDERTRQIILLGAPYDGHMFSQDLPDQMTYVFLCTAVMAGQAQYPIEVRDMSDIPYYLADAGAFYTFYFTGGAYLQAILTSGRAIKDQVNACTTIEQVNAIVDPR